MFEDQDYVCELKATMRFQNDPVLTSILAKMRTPGDVGCVHWNVVMWDAWVVVVMWDVTISCVVKLRSVGRSSRSGLFVGSVR